MWFWERGRSSAEGLGDSLRPFIPTDQVLDETPERMLLFGDPHCMSGFVRGGDPRPSTRVKSWSMSTPMRGLRGCDFAACTSLAMRDG